MSRYRRPLKTRETLYEKYITEICKRLNNAKTYFFLNEMNKKDLPAISCAMYFTAFWCLFVVLLVFWLYCVTSVTPLKAIWRVKTLSIGFMELRAETVGFRLASLLLFLSYC